MRRRNQVIVVFLFIATFGFGLLMGWAGSGPIIPILVGFFPAEALAPMLTEEEAEGYIKKGIGGMIGGLIGLIGWSILH